VIIIILFLFFFNGNAVELDIPDYDDNIMLIGYYLLPRIKCSTNDVF